MTTGMQSNLQRNHVAQARRRLNRCRRAGTITERDLDYITQDLTIAGCTDESLLEEVAMLEIEVVS